MSITNRANDMSMEEQQVAQSARARGSNKIDSQEILLVDDDHAIAQKNRNIFMYDGQPDAQSSIFEKNLIARGGNFQVPQGVGRRTMPRMASQPQQLVRPKNTQSHLKRSTGRAPKKPVINHQATMSQKFTSSKTSRKKPNSKQRLKRIPTEQPLN